MRRRSEAPILDLFDPGAVRGFSASGKDPEIRGFRRGRAAEPAVNGPSVAPRRHYKKIQNKKIQNNVPLYSRRHVR